MFFSTLFSSSKLQDPLVYYNINKTKQMICDTFTSTFDSSLKKNVEDGEFLPWSFQLAICLKCNFFINNCIESSFINLELGML
jgi:hypothetical protein